MAEQYTVNEIFELLNSDVLCVEELERLSTSIAKFSVLMRDKLFDKAVDGHYGWDRKCNEQYIKDSLAEHVKKGDYVDVANIAMMLHFLALKGDKNGG